MQTNKQATRLQKISEQAIVIRNALEGMSIMGGEVPRNPDTMVELANEIHDASVELLKQSKKFSKKMKKEIHA